MEIVNWSDYIKALCSDRDVEREAVASAPTVPQTFHNIAINNSCLMYTVD